MDVVGTVNGVAVFDFLLRSCRKFSDNYLISDFFPTLRTIPEISVNLQRKFLGKGGGRVPLESTSCSRHGAVDDQSVKVFGLCFTLIGWLFSPLMWKILGFSGASRTNVARVTALRTFQIFLQKSVFIPECELVASW